MSFLTTDGPDLGGPSAIPLAPPDVALLVGGEIPSSRGGEVWHALSEDAGIAVSRIDVERLGGIDLGRYSVVIVPGGRPGETAATALMTRVREGGRLVLLGSAVEWGVDAGLLPLAARTEPESAVRENATWAERRAARGSRSLPGTILDLRLDPTHPLAFGIGDRLPLHATGAAFFERGQEEAARTVDLIGSFASEPLLAGYLPGHLRPAVSGAVGVVVATQGRGRIVGIVGDPAFRGAWTGSVRLLWNAVLLAPAY